MNTGRYLMQRISCNLVSSPIELRSVMNLFEGVNISACFQEKLHNRGVAAVRGLYERAVYILFEEISRN